MKPYQSALCVAPSLLAVVLAFVAFQESAACQEQDRAEPRTERAVTAVEPELAKELMERVARDQAARMKLIEVMNQKELTAEEDASKNAERTQMFDEVDKIDSENREWLKEQVAKRGWLGKALVGAEAAHAAWLLVQHADGDLAFQKHCLETMKAAADGDVAAIDIAYLTDRVLVAEKQPQIYGTQCYEIDGKYEPRPVSDPANLDARRQEIGLPPMSEYLSQMQAIYKPVGNSGSKGLPTLPGNDESAEAISAGGQILKRTTDQSNPPPEFVAVESDYRSNPADIENAIWYGRRLAYQGRYRESIRVFTKAIETSPRDARLYRHRGHRWITIRQFDQAIKDLEFAGELINGTEDAVEPDGQPNAAGVPTSTLHTNIWYHLGLAKFLTGDYEGALAAYEKCLDASRNDDMRIATLYWRFQALARSKGEGAAVQSIAEVSPETKLLENHAYHRLLLLYRGLIKPQEIEKVSTEKTSDVERATIGFGLGHWYLIRNETDKARSVLEAVVENAEEPGMHWAPFGFIAAETELARLAADKPVENQSNPLVTALWFSHQFAASEALTPANDQDLKSTLLSALETSATDQDARLTWESLQSVFDKATFHTITGGKQEIKLAKIERLVQEKVPSERLNLFPSIRQHMDLLTTQFDMIDEPHRQASEQLVAWISENYQPDQPLEIIVICTGNSRRSIMGATLGNIAAAYYGMLNVRFYSGGTTPSAFNSRTVNTLQAIGVEVELTGEEAPRGKGGDANPIYNLRFGSGLERQEFSKRYDDDSNPQAGFAAILICKEAEASCPFVTGAAARFPIPYLDPKVYDGAPFEAAKYAERRDDIGRLMLSVLMQSRRRLAENGRVN